VRAIGIDLGTTHSLVAHVDARNRPQVLPVDEGGPLLASAVWYGAGGAVEVGAAPRRRAPERPLDTVLSVKRLMGRGAGDLSEAERAVHRLEPGGEPLRLRVADGARAVTPVEVSAEILRALRRRAAEALGGAPGPCVITVPAHFDEAQRQATRDAGRLAGLDVVRLLSEPTAAALAYGLDQRRAGVFAVYDLGGGTFDVSVLRLEGGVFQVLATGGDTHLGGDDLDELVAARLLAEAGATGAAPALRRAAAAAARQMREGLSSAERVESELPLPGGGRLVARLTRAELEALIAPVVERTTAPCLDALRAAGAPRLDGVVLVGGVTRTPLVRQHVRAVFGQEPLADLDPDTVVALGAAAQADALDRGGRDDVLLLDVIPLSLGVEMMGGVVETLVPRNASLPASATQVFTTHADGQTGMVLHVVQGERELAQDCRSLARFTLRGIPPLPAGFAQVELTYTVDTDGLLHVSARERATGLTQEVHVRPTFGLSEGEVEAMLVESLEHAEEDVAERFLREARVEGERVLTALDLALAEDGDLLDASERAALEERAAGLRRAMAGEDFGVAQAWLGSLAEASRPFAERRMSRAVERVVGGRRADEVAREGADR
jgi:molecular chaperone HscA